ncbi:MAG TPA: hypothetical protein VJ110_01840 [Candidatus Nanoarchaeia archaeon]|nr:hypothetical protein [Candidatus Nanoarchaeia archaeon]
MARRRAKRRKAAAAPRASREAKVRFFGHEILLTFIGSLIISLGALLATTGLQPLLLTWLLSAVIMWLGLLVFLFPVVRKLEDLM